MSAYCYSVWLRHMVMAEQNNLNTSPRIVAELGPGDSLGIGLTALVFGAEKYYAFDVVEFAEIKKNLRVFEDIVAFAKKKRNIPDENEFPEVKPYLDNYSFPEHIFPEERLNRCLKPERLERIRESIQNPHRDDSVIRYVVPWSSQSVLERNTVDLIFSQAVLEHVDDLRDTYKAMYDWLNDDGYLSHQIDFKSHGTAKDWNGHWLYSDFLWNIIRGKRPYLLNRQPYSSHKRLLKQEGFSRIQVKKVQADSAFTLQQVNKQSRQISEEDLNTCGAYILATK
ncbi:Methyltransferase type 11 domain-containing protein [Candidatus Electrothrix laxa]